MATEILNLPEVTTAQAQKELTINDAFRRLEGSTIRALSSTTATPPATPADGDVYIIPVGATDAWDGLDSQIAHYYGGAWRYYVPPDGLSLWVTATSHLLRYSGFSGTWVDETAGAISTFLGLTDTPDSYTGHALKQIRVNATEDALEFAAAVSAFLGLTDTPDAYTGQTLKHVRVNAAEDALEFVDPLSTFLALTDAPDAYTGQALKLTRVNAGETAIEFVDPPPITAPYVLGGGFFEGGIPASAIMLFHVFAMAADFPVNLAGSQGAALTAATAQTDFDIQENGVSIGTARFAAAATTCTFILAGGSTPTAGDTWKVVAPATPDATLAGVTFSFLGSRAV